MVLRRCTAISPLMRALVCVCVCGLLGKVAKQVLQNTFYSNRSLACSFHALSTSSSLDCNFAIALLRRSKKFVVALSLWIQPIIENLFEKNVESFQVFDKKIRNRSMCKCMSHAA